jgi:aarF domain-containing kinase
MLQADIAWLLRLGRWTESVERLRLLGLRKATEEFCEQLQMQTDLRTEAENLERFRANFAAAEGSSSGGLISFPAPLHATEDLLVLSREEGCELAHIFHQASRNGATSGEEKAEADALYKRRRIPLSVNEVPLDFAHSHRVYTALGISADVGRCIAKESIGSYMRMIFHDNFIHGDLHPGNVMLQLQSQPGDAATAAASTVQMGNPQGCVAGAARVRDNGSGAQGSSDGSSEDGEGVCKSWLRQNVPESVSSLLLGPAPSAFKLVILDTGLAMTLPKEKVEALRSLAIAVIYGDYPKAAQVLYDQSPDTSRCRDPAAFKAGLAKAFKSCRKAAWEEGYCQVSDACLAALNHVQRYNVALDTSLTWTLIGMLSVEGAARQLDPQVDVAGAATEYVVTLPAMLQELRQGSWNSCKHMIAELVFQRFGVDYWMWRYNMGWTWQQL